MSSYRLWLIRHGMLEMNEAVIFIDTYIRLFKSERKVISRLYKYMYQYLMNGEVNDEPT